MIFVADELVERKFLLDHFFINAKKYFSCTSLWCMLNLLMIFVANEHSGPRKCEGVTFTMFLNKLWIEKIKIMS
jgi:hypothetical protein